MTANEYKVNEKLQPIVGEIGWSKNVVIMGECSSIWQSSMIKSRKR